MTKLPDPMAEDIKAVFEKHTMPEAGDPDLTMFDTEAIITDLAAYTTNKIIEELEQPLTGAIPRTDKYAQGWNDCRQDIRGRFKQRINKLKALNHRKEME